MSIEDDIAAIDATLTERVTTGQTTKIRDRHREIEMSKVSEGELSRRRDDLVAQRDGSPRRITRRVLF